MALRCRDPDPVAWICRGHRRHRAAFCVSIELQMMKVNIVADNLRES
ncbi:MAG: hypothetical protein KA250_06660 [Verrucomicrobiales bacterium]|nr:hypothetical protein [Verrucomicrobiales bacterium]MBP9226192.1 hypothetical protein [Verrucomicrobiales bacterium]HQZ29047.1 hypothetical protein [Verrucomicrobiales bacterium]